MSTPNSTEANKIRTTQAFVNLEDFENVVLVKETEFIPPTSVQDALQRLGNDRSKLLAMVSEGMRSEAIRTLRADDSQPWMDQDDEGNMVAFTGSVADSKAVNDLRATLAKTLFGYQPGRNQSDDVKAANKKAREQAMEMIRTTDAIKNGLRAQATKE